jgi:hypothetical protein
MVSRFLIILIIIISLCPLSSATIINIPADYPAIQQGIDASADGDTVLVQPGTYVENINFNGHNIVLGSLFLTTGDTSYIEQTVIDGDSAGTVVTFDSGEDSTAFVIGLTISNGFSLSGAGIICNSSSPVISKNIIIENNSVDKGGGLYFGFNSNPRISDNFILANTADLGGGFYGDSSNSMIQYNIIADNTARRGGGFYCGPGSDLAINNNVIRENVATGPNFGGRGGGGFIYDCSNLTIINSEISRNTAIGRGGGVYLQLSNSIFDRNTISDNFAYLGSDAIYCLDSSPLITNSIIWEAGGSNIYLWGNSIPQISYCNINGIWEGEGNIHVNPLFVDRENNDYNVCAESPCIDSGDPDMIDPDGTRVDIGVYYYEHPQCPYGGYRWYVSTAGSDTTGDGSEQNPFRTIQHAIDISISGDTVLATEGTYVENIIFNGKNIILGSLFLTTRDTSYIPTTVIDGNGNTAVIFSYGESENADITGFTIKNGRFGIYCYNSSPTISHNIIRHNHDSSNQPGVIAWAGGIKCDYSNSTIISNYIAYNSAVSDDAAVASGIECRNSRPEIKHNTIVHTHATSYLAQIVAGIYLQGCINPYIVNNVIMYNNGGDGGGINSYQTSYISINNIIRENTPWNISGSPLTVIYCNVEGGWPGIGNIDLDPFFRDPENGDFHLMSTACSDPFDSPCIDGGDPNILDSLLDCSWGLGGPRSDMGAYGGGDSLITAIFDNIGSIPGRFMLLQNYPNPFNAQTTIRFVLPESQNVELTIYDLLGRRVEILIDEFRTAGIHACKFDASDFPSGVYFARLETKNETKSIKMLLLK